MYIESDYDAGSFMRRTDRWGPIHAWWANSNLPKARLRSRIAWPMHQFIRKKCKQCKYGLKRYIADLYSRIAARGPPPLHQGSRSRQHEHWFSVAAMLPIKRKVFRQVDVVSSACVIKCVCVCVGEEGAQASMSTSQSCDARLSGHVRLSICIVSIFGSWIYSGS